MNQPPATAEIGIIGGSGLYALLDGATEHAVATPYGPHWYLYLMRRLAERPANLAWFATNMLRR